MAQKISVVDVAVAANMIADLVVKFRQAGVPVTIDSLRARVDELERQADANDAVMGVKPD